MRPDQLVLLVEQFLAAKGFEVATDCTDDSCEYGGHMHPVGRAHVEFQGVSRKRVRVEGVDWKVLLLAFLEEQGK